MTVPSSITLLHLPLILLLLLLGQSQGSLNDCVDLPRPPMNGKLVYVDGSLTARLKCTKKGFDLPANSPGNGGVLTCHPNSTKPLDFDYVVRQKCLPYQKPDKLYTQLDIAITSASCDQAVEAAVLYYFTHDIPKQCTNRITCSSVLQNERPICDKDYSFHEKGQPFQISIALQLFTDYNPNIPITVYLEELEVIKSRYLTNLPLNLRGAKFQAIHASPWMAYCSEHKATRGTDLALEGVAACRGCAQSYFMDKLTFECQPCEELFYTPNPPADKCSVCPKANEWDSVDDYLDNCIQRDYA